MTDTRDYQDTFQYLTELIKSYKRRLRKRIVKKNRKSRFVPSDAIIVPPDHEISPIMPSAYLKNLRIIFLSTSHGIGMTCIIPDKFISFIPNAVHCINIHAVSSKRLARLITYDWMVENIMES